MNQAGAPDRLISAALVLPIGAPAIAEGAVAVDAQGTVVAVAPRAELRTSHPRVREDRANGVLMPGLVNAHVHVELSALAAQVPGGRGLVAWAGALVPLAAALPSPVAEAAAAAAARGMVDAGTAAVGDVANTLAVVPALAEAGLGGVVFHELVGSREARTGDAIADAEAEKARFVARHGWPERLRYALAPHAPYSVGPELLRRLFADAATRGGPTTIHVAEDPDEIALLADGTGAWPPVLARLGVAAGSRTPRARPIEYLASLGAFVGAAPPLLVHFVCAEDRDRADVARTGATVVLCPRSNLYIGGRLADAPAWIRAGVPLALGTDSLASTPSLSLWGEVATLARAFPDVDPASWLRAATLGGAEALRLPAFGAIAPGRRPGLIDVDAPTTSLADALDALTHTPQPTLRWMARP